MKLNQLRDMVAIVDHGSLRAAARRLGVAQPLLTRSVHALEEELGVPLFERSAQGMAVTPMGRLFHTRAHAMLQEMRRARDEIAQASGGDGGLLSVALSIMPHVGMLPRALPAFRTRYPGVTLQISEGLFNHVEPALRNGTLDFYLGTAPPVAPAPGLSCEWLFANPRAVFARKGHPLANATSLRELVGAEWATTRVDYDSEQDFAAVFTRHRLSVPRVAVRAASALSIMVALTSTDLLAFLPLQWRHFALTAGALQSIAIAEMLPAPDMVLIRRVDLPLTPAAAFFCDLMKQQAPQDTGLEPPASSGRADPTALRHIDASSIAL